MGKYITYHKERGHCSIVYRNTIPNRSRPIKEVWYFKQKKKPNGDLLNHKALRFAHVGIQQRGNRYWKTYSPVVNMISIRLILTIAKVHHLDSRAISFVLAFPQEDLEECIWMQLPIGLQVDIQTGADS